MAIADSGHYQQHALNFRPGLQPRLSTDLSSLTSFDCSATCVVHTRVCEVLIREKNNTRTSLQISKRDLMHHLHTKQHGRRRKTQSFVAWHKSVQGIKTSCTILLTDASGEIKRDKKRGQ